MLELNSFSMSDLRQALVSSRLVSAPDMAGACAAHEASGGALSMHLVLLGAVDDEALASFSSSISGMPRVTPRELAAAHSDAASGVPFEVLYSGGFVPFGVADAGTLLVAVMDPVVPEGVDAAEAMSGKRFVLRLCSVSQFAALFEKVSGRPWKVLPQEVAMARRAVGESGEGLDAELRALFAPSTSTSSSGPRVAVELVGDTGDEPLVDLPLAERVTALDAADLEEVAAGSEEVSASVSASALFGPRPGVQAESLGRPVRSSSSGAFEAEQPLDLSAADVAARGEAPSRSSHGSLRAAFEIELVDESDLAGEAIVELVPAGARAGGGVSGVEYGEAWVSSATDPRDLETSPDITTTLHGIDPRILPLQDVHGAGGPVSDEFSERVPTRVQEVTPAMAVEVVPSDLWEELDSAPWGASSGQRTPTTGVPAVLAGESGMREVLSREESGSVDSRALSESGAHRGSLSFSAAGEVFASGAHMVPTVGELLDDGAGCFFSRDAYLARAADPDEATRAVFGLTRDALELAGDRDTLARQLVETLSFAYPTTLLLSLRTPDVVVWDGVLCTGADSPSGLEFPLAEEGVWHRVSTRGEIFVGTLPASDPLRRLLPRAFGAQACVAPLWVGRRVVALLVLDAGPTPALASPGPELFALAGWVESALKRLIVQRKNASRSF